MLHVEKILDFAWFSRRLALNIILTRFTCILKVDSKTNASVVIRRKTIDLMASEHSPHRCDFRRSQYGSISALLIQHVLVM